MRTRVVTVDGKSYWSDRLSDEELAKTAKENGISVDEMIEKVIELLRDFRNLTFLSIKIDGHDMYFNPENIIYIQVEERV